ncbi:hypothetical protein D9619_001937 [Psilocybe cf. subviscida]|uniref:Calcineurin-like phosphoesterase domain-containing protein n=1 Tax=Psilocybe cf. subviscida TaxID=2480587 RepID=A0A8H5F2Y1_9AGAR|nr:hypothetical protein D9619_001937 [Psilocybe cf. subviscida]
MASLFRRRVVINLLRAFWVIIIFWYEYGTFYSSVHDCNWPDLTLYPSDVGATYDANISHVLLVADPQIVDRYSYPSRNFLVAHLTRLIVDLNLRKNWKAAIEKKPDAIVFLGDMMDNGRDSMSDAEYESYFQRFQSIFKADASIPQYFIPGNHDTGLGRTEYFSPHAHSRYVNHFGSPNTEISIANHTLVLFDAPNYADEDSQRYGQGKKINQWVPRKGGSLEYMKAFAKANHSDPVILFSHIPLYRPDGKSCGPLREKGNIRPGVGPGYQNVLEKLSSQRLLEAFKPAIVFSGDDHDYCEYTHHLSLRNAPIQETKEVTVKTISMVMNVRRPGFQLLSLAPALLHSETSETLAERPCVLPDQLRIYLQLYIPSLITSLLIVFLVSLRHRSTFHNKADSNLAEVHLLSDIEEGTGDAVESTFTSSRRQPTSSGRLNSRMTTINPGWRIAPEERYSKSNSFNVSEWLCGFADVILSASGRSRGPSSRRSWLLTFLRDVRDVAVFPIATFIFITWWTVSN